MIVLLCNWVKANYNGSSATIKRDEYGFYACNFFFLYSHCKPIICFTPTCRTCFFCSDIKERGWKVILHKNLPKKWIIETIQTNLTKFDIYSNLKMLMITLVYKILFQLTSHFNLQQLLEDLLHCYSRFGCYWCVAQWRGIWSR